jgi:hypothetical protein
MVSINGEYGEWKVHPRGGLWFAIVGSIFFLLLN